MSGAEVEMKVSIELKSQKIGGCTRQGFDGLAGESF